MKGNKGSFLLGMFMTLLAFGAGHLFHAARHPESVQKSQDWASRQQIFSFEYPATLDFAGEKVPVTEMDVHERLDKEIQVNAYWQSNMILMLKKSHRWRSELTQILKEEGVPEDFYFLALAESGLSNLVSGKGAKGFWQFIPETAKQFGLTVNENIDERLDPIKATRAACRYLKESYAKFGSWTLAAAAYNMGNGGVNSALKVQMANSYYDLYLNQETSRYVFRILAIKLILNNPEEYGYKLYHRDLYQPYHLKKVKVDGSITDLAAFASAMGANYKTLKILNPWLLQNKLTVESGKSFELWLPETAQEPKPIQRNFTDSILLPGTYSDPPEEPYRKPDSFK
jgi:membrane-bound lytic murein transglycosylase D